MSIQTSTTTVRMMMMTAVVMVGVVGVVGAVPLWQRVTTPSPAPRTVLYTNTTVYGSSNLCKTCTTSTFNCTYSIYKPCFQSANTTADQHNDQPSQRPSGDRKKRDNPQRRFLRPGFGGGPWRLTRCRHTVQKTCTERRCDMTCCDGTAMETGTMSCKQRKKNDGTIDSCMNGGTLNSRLTHCTCPDGFIGVQCQHRACSIKCQNGGQCQTNTSTTGGELTDTSHNHDYCVCPSDTSGRFCEINICTKECKNNGTCVNSWGWPRCVCQLGFSGDTCEKREKDGDCPAAGDLKAARGCHFGFYRHHTYECNHDEDCDGVKKCCRDSCYNRVCTEPHTPNITCSYNNVTYALNTTFNPDPCRICTCNTSLVDDYQGAIECTRLMCPSLPPSCSNVTTLAGHCCPICYDHLDLHMCGGTYKPPYFVNCPQDPVVIDVEQDSDTASLSLNLVARDCRGGDLAVHMSDSRFVAGLGNDNERLVSATSERDAKGNFALCSFHVRIRDTQPPEFLTCPMDMLETANMPLTWPQPVARDNVGLKIPPTSSNHPGSRLPVGSYVIEYWTQDYEGNIARCSFLITVQNAPDEPQAHAQHHTSNINTHNSHSSSKQPNDNHNNVLVVGVTCACTVLVLLVCGIMVMFYRRYRKSWVAAQGALSTPPGPRSLNGMTNGGGNWNGNNIGRYPVSTDVMSPPGYSRNDGMLASGMASVGAEAGELPAKTPLPE